MSELFLLLSPAELALTALILFFAYAIKGMSGFGSGLVAIPLLAFIFPLTVIVPVMGLLSYSGTVMQSVQLRKQAVWADIVPVIPFSVVGVLMATWLLVNADAEILVRILGCFVAVYAIYALLPLPELSGGRRWGMLAGAGGGIVGALFGTGGPFYVIYLKLRQLDKQAFRATIVTIFLLDGGARLISYAMNGLYTRQVLLLAAILFPVLLAGLYAGNHLHLKISQLRFNQLISSLLIMSGVMLVIKTL